MPTTMTAKAQVTIPKAVRDKVGIQPGDRVEVRVGSEGNIVVHRLLPERGLLPFCFEGANCLPSTDEHAENQSCRDCGNGHECPLVPARHLLEPVGYAWRTGDNGLVAEVALEVGGEAVGGLIATAAVLFQALHHDPVEIGGECGVRNGECGMF